MCVCVQSVQVCTCIAYRKNYVREKIHKIHKFGHFAKLLSHIVWLLADEQYIMDHKTFFPECLAKISAL